jgi:hypothetical protein
MVGPVGIEPTTRGLRMQNRALQSTSARTVTAPGMSGRLLTSFSRKLASCPA